MEFLKPLDHIQETSLLLMIFVEATFSFYFMLKLRIRPPDKDVSDKYHDRPSNNKFRPINQTPYQYSVPKRHKRVSVLI